MKQRQYKVIETENMEKATQRLNEAAKEGFRVISVVCNKYTCFWTLEREIKATEPYRPAYRQIEMDKHFILYCKKCLWTPGVNAACKNKCPNCNVGLTLMKGTKEEIEDFFWNEIAVPVPVYGASFPDKE